METDNIRQELADMRRMLQQLLTAQKKMLTLKDVAVLRLAGYLNKIGYEKSIIDCLSVWHSPPILEAG